MRKVLLVTHFYNTHRGGVEIAAFNIAKLLSSSDKFDIIWAAADCDKIPSDIANLNFHPLKSSNIIEKFLPFPYPIIFPKGIYDLWKLVGLSDIVHLHDFLYFSNICGFIFAKLRKKKIVITQHIGFIPYKDKILRNILQIMNKYLGVRILGSANKTIFISKLVMDYFINISHYYPQNFLFVPNFLNTEVFYPYPQEKRTMLRDNYGVNKITFLFVGRFTEKKGLDIIKIIAQKFKSIDFILAGWGSIEPENWNLDNIKVVKGLSGEKIAELYNVADALILPSYGEGFPLVVQEAISCGLDLFISQEIVRSYPDIEQFTMGIYDYDSSNLNDFIEQISRFSEKYKYDYENRIIKHDFAQEHWQKDMILSNYIEVFDN